METFGGHPTPVGWWVLAPLCKPSPHRRWHTSRQWSMAAWTQGRQAWLWHPGWPSMATLASRWVARDRGAEGHGSPSTSTPMSVGFRAH